MSSPVTEIKGAIEGLHGAFSDFKSANDERLDELKTGQAELLDRVEELESRRNGPGRPGPAAEPEHKVFHTASGPVYELPSHVKLADVERKRAPEISLERWLGALVAGERSGDKAALEFVREQKQVTTATSGTLIPAQYIGQWIDLLRNAMVLNNAGMHTVVMDAATQQRSALAADPATTWHVEAADDISVGNPSFAARTLTARTVAARCTASVEVAADSPDFGRQLAQAMTRAIARELDRVGLEGSGTPPEPGGLKHAAGVSVLPGVGAPDYGDLLQGVKLLLDANVNLEAACAVAIMSPHSWLAFESLVTGISGDETPRQRPKALANTRFLVTNAIADGSPIQSTIYQGDFTDLLMGVRKEASVEILKLGNYASSLVLEFIAYARADFIPVRPASFVRLTGVS